MNPEEARKKYCPFKYFTGGWDGYNDRCCLEECMAWNYNLKKKDDNPCQYKYPYEVDYQDRYCMLIEK